jgi:hypothetical protein
MYKAERSSCQQENVCSIRSEVSSSVMTVVWYVSSCRTCAFVVLNMRVKKENVNAHVCHMPENEEFRCNVFMRKERLEEISDQQSDACKACTGRSAHRVRGTGELGAARRCCWARHGLGGGGGSSCDCSVAGYS